MKVGVERHETVVKYVWYCMCERCVKESLAE